MSGTRDMVGAVTSALLKELGETWDKGPLHVRDKVNFQIGTTRITWELH